MFVVESGVQSDRAVPPNQSEHSTGDSETCDVVLVSTFSQPLTIVRLEERVRMSNVRGTVHNLNA